MERSEENIYPPIEQHFVTSFQCLEEKLNNNQNINEKGAAWRQQSLVANSFTRSLANDCMKHLWLHYDSRFENSNALDKYFKGGLPGNEYGRNLKFPNIEEMNFPKECSDDEMFTDTFIVNDRNIEKVAMSVEQQVNSVEQTSSKSRNTMENFLNGEIAAKSQTHSFCSARQFLAVQMMKKQSNENITTFNGRNMQQKPEVGFNFAATKKSLGSLGRVVNSSRKNFVSPVRNNSTVNADNTNEEILDPEILSLLTHPALKNVDPKMIETINNEIIHKFKPVDWNEIAGLDYAKSIIKEAVVYPLLRPDIFTGLRRPPRGILLFGPPGTGKTLIGKCIASQSSSTFFSISSSSLTSKWMGEGEKMVRAMFAVAVARQPSVIFIDEIDSLLSQRSENENEGTRRLKTEFLVRLDGAATSDEDRVLIVGATNRPQELDEAVRRRFVKRLYVPLPQMEARAEILTNLLKTVDNTLNSKDINEIAKLADGYSGADMDSLCREASMEPVRALSSEAIITFNKEQLRPVNMDDFHSALKKIRPSVSQSDLNQYVEWNRTYGSSY